MSLLKICSLILFYFISRAAFAAAPTCIVFKGHQLQEKLCFNDSIKGWVSERCMGVKKKCEVNKFFEEKKSLPDMTPKNGQNPAALYCHHLKLEVIVLRDPQEDEQSFCVFKDKTIVDANAVERHVK